MALHESYYNYNGERERRSTETHNGQRHGAERIWYEGGQMKLERHFRLGQLHGVIRGWNKDGRLAYEHYYLHGHKVRRAEHEAYQSDFD